MLTMKNRMTLPITLGTFLLAAAVHALFRWLHWFGLEPNADLASYAAMLNAALAAPVVFLAAAALCYWKDWQKLSAMMNALSMIFSALAMITGAGGTVEFHFALFMVIALLAFYEDALIVWTVAAVTAVADALAYFLFPELVFGQEGYEPGLLIVHGLFLFLTASTTVWQTARKKRSLALLEAEKQAKQELLLNAVERLTATSSDLVRYASQMKDNADRTVDSNRGIAQAMQEMAVSAEEQAQSGNDSARAMEEMAQGVLRVAESSSFVSEAAMSMVQEAEQGNDTVQRAVNQLGVLKRSVHDVAAALVQLEKQSEQIGEIAVLITGIASQTNLLALNAAIEAARAGEHGAGFAVVASEVRKLAEQTEGSAGDITALIEEVQGSVAHAVKLMHTGAEDVEAGNTSVNEAGETFRTILEASRRISDQIQEISAAAQEMSAGTEQVTASLNEMARISGRSSEQAQQAREASASQLAAMESIAAATEGLNKLVGELEQVCSGLRGKN